VKVAVLGLGYVGMVTAACLASRGHDGRGVDIVAAKIDEIRASRSHAVLDALLKISPRQLIDPSGRPISEVESLPRRT
jgi:UDP-N-acetyl-D-mannosaminuronate dehydrogenase